MVRTTRLLMAGAIAMGLLAPANAEASIAYVTGPDPWGTTSNDQAMNAAFGAGNWNKLQLTTAIAAGLLTPGAYDFIFIDGGDGTDTNFVNFLNSHRTSLENWVAAGGSLLMNAATWFQPNTNVGFGGTSVQAFDGPRSIGSATGPHPLFDGTTGLSWSGNFFAHNHINGAGFTPLINDAAARPVLVERDWGLGHVMLGGITTANFHSPPTQAFNLRVNMLEYGAAQFSPGVVPEAASLAIWSGLAMVGAALAYRRHKG